MSNDSGRRASAPEAGRGLLFIVSAPSGAGKTTLVERLVERVPDLARSRSYTSRAARADEIASVDYNFITRSRFEDMVGRGEFLEHADVFGNLYGTRAEDLERLLASGRDVVLVIDVQGARQVRRQAARSVAVFVLPPSFAILESRLRGRSQDSEDAMQRRLSTARSEVSAFADYDYVVVNDDVETCVDRLRAIVLAERARLAAMRPAIATILGSFRSAH